MGIFLIGSLTWILATLLDNNRVMPKWSGYLNLCNALTEVVVAPAWVGLLAWSASSILGSVGVVKPLCGRVAGLGSRPPTVRTCFTSALWGV